LIKGAVQDQSDLPILVLVSAADLTFRFGSDRFTSITQIGKEVSHETKIP
jgi:hypothetical protein